MKVVNLQSKEQQNWWVVVHELSLAEGRLRRLRPIHVFTLLAQTLVKGKIRKEMFAYCMALENKLFGVRFHQIELRKVIAGVGDIIYLNKYVRDYDDEQKLICTMEAYSNAIYTALELTAHINRLMRPTLNIGFRRQSKKFEPFSFTKWSWLPRFYDVRTELAHFGTSLPIVKEAKFIMKFTQTKQLRVFKKGKTYEISFTEILNYSIALFKMLDDWAESEISKVDGEQTVDSIVETGLNQPLKSEKIKAKEILDLLKK